jgi:tetratricopeptide (TPR) repeat protein
MPPRVFISFSSLDVKKVRRLFARLGAQPIDIWDYSTEGAEIPGGTPIGEYLEEKIGNSDFFFPIVSENSFASRYTTQEVQSALRQWEAGKVITILPLLDEDCEYPPEDWPSPYDQLRNTRYYRVNFLSRRSLEEAVMMMCESLNLAYRPLLTSDENLPFLEKLVKELDQQIPHRTDRDIGIYRRLMLILDEFQEAYDTGDYRFALDRATFMVMNLETDFKEKEFYYPYIVKTVCELACGMLIPASETLEHIWKHPLLDENAFGAMGYIKYQQGDYLGALDFYRALSERDNTDPAARSWIAKTSLLLGMPVDVDKLFDPEAEARIKEEKDKRQFNMLKALALSGAGRFYEAEAVYRDILNKGCNDPTFFTNYAYVLIEMGQQNEALELLERKAGEVITGTGSIRHLVASLQFLLGQPQSAADQLKALVTDYPENRQYRFDAAQILCCSGNFDEARAVMAPMRDPRTFPLPITEYDFYYDGFSSWLHEDKAAAEFDFQRSRQPKEKHYRDLLANGKVLFHVSE